MKIKFIIIISICAVIVGLIAFNYYSGLKNTEKPVACTLEAKLCSDGSYVGRTGPNCEFTLCPHEDLIRVFSPQANEKVSSPLLIKGEARGSWFFEATFPVKLLDDKGNIIVQHYAQAKGDWMTENFVPFEAELVFEAPTTQKGWLVLEKDNPSSLSENADELRIPVIFSDSKTVKLYYYNPKLDQDETDNILCSRKGLVAVEREISLTQTPIQDTIKLLIAGQLTPEEKSQGLTTEYPLEGFSLTETNLKPDGTLILKFEDSLNKTSGGSCRVGILWFQIEVTAKQFPEVQQVRFLPEELFQP
jgi:hypothetical protein